MSDRLLTPDEVAAESWHGTASGYTNHACRCAACSTAGRAARRDHYYRTRVLKRKKVPAVSRILRRVEIDADGCWIDPKAIKYSRTAVDGVTRLTHRVMYEELVGPIPDGFEVDHLCGTPACVNPEHLEAVTPQENMRRFQQARTLVTHCKRGHEYDDANTYWYKGRRDCRACARARRAGA